MTLLEGQYAVVAQPPAEERQVARWDAAAKHLLHQVGGLLSDFSADEIETLHGALKQANIQPQEVSETEQALALTLTGRQYSQAESISLELTALLQYFEQRKALLKEALTTKQVAQLLGTSRQTPHDRVEKGSLLAVLDKGVWKFPSWQFDPEGPDGVVDGFPDVLSALTGSHFAKLNWLVAPSRSLGGVTPIAMLKQGHKTAVLREAQALGAW
jgi:hypothetical protein